MSFLLPLCIVLALTFILVPLGRRLGLPTLLGYIITGFIANQFLTLIPTWVAEHWSMRLAEVAIFAFMFLIGLELRPSQLWKTRQQFNPIDALHLIILGLLISSILFLVFQTTLPISLFLGLALAVPSNMLIKQLISKSHISQLVTGHEVFTSYKVHYYLVFLLLITLPLFQHQFSILRWIAYLAIHLSFICLLFMFRFSIINWLNHIKYPDIPTLWNSIAFFTLITALILAHLLNINPAFAALLVGIVMADSEFRDQIYYSIQPFKGMLLAILFISMGFFLNIKDVLNYPWHITDLFIGIIIIKFFCALAVAAWYKYQTNHLFQYSIPLTQSGEIGFMMLFLAYQKQLIPIHIVTIITLVIVCSMFVTPLLIKFTQYINTSQKI